MIIGIPKEIMPGERRAWLSRNCQENDRQGTTDLR